MSTLVKHDQTREVHGNRSVTVKGNETQTFEADHEISVTGASTGKYDGGRTETVKNGDSLTVEGSDKTTMVGGEYNIVAVKHYNASSGENATCDVDLKEGVVTITAKNEIHLVCGDATLSLKSDGTVTIKGPKAVNATGAMSELELAGPGAKLSGKPMTKISGGMVEINE
jgi:type VI secretion system secreted protein VgrG